MPAPTDGVPYPQPLAGPEPQYMPWGLLLVRPIGHPLRPVPPRAADLQSRAYPTLLRVLKWGRYGHRGGPKTPEVGSLACVFSFRPAPPFAVWFVVVGFLSPLGVVGWRWWGAGPSLSWSCCLCACPRHSWLRLAAGGGEWSLTTPG